MLIAAIGFNIPVLYAATSDSYIDKDTPILKIKDINQQAQTWATCSAAYTIISEIFKSEPANSKQMANLGRGASMAVAMSLVLDDFKNDISPEKFNSLWSFAQMASKEWPKIHSTRMLADFENMGNQNSEAFVDKVSNTVKFCMSNLEAQQFYIDSWRELYKSGLLTDPK